MSEMEEDMRFEILGPMRVSVRDREIPMTAGRDRAVLAMLVLHANRVVSRSALIDAAWDVNAPKDARSQLHGCVSRLRKRLAGPPTTDRIIVTEPDGYRLCIDSGSVDLLEFRSLVSEARTAAADGQPDKARERYRAALALWRGGAVLAGLDRGPIRQVAAGLEEERTRTLEERIELELALGGAGELIGELTELVHEHPYRERLHAALMLALHRADRQADALAAYQRIRTTLVDELGQEPGPALRSLHQRILTGDANLRPAAATPHNYVGSAHRAGRHLPRTLHDFTGREADLAWLTDIANQADPYAPPVITIDGMPGVGKTSLAIRGAYVLERGFPDGQLFIDLHGHSAQDPVEPATALSTLLRQLGVPASRIAPDLDERIAQWRAELATRRAIVVLDNAASTAQVIPLLPASPRCLVLVTSRRRLVDLDGSRPLSVGTLDPDDAIALLERIAGPRIAAEPEAAAEVAKRCGYLPLALRLAAARLAHRPRWRVRDLADRLADPQSSLAELTAGDQTVMGTFALSYSHLAPTTQRLFRLLGKHSGDHFDTRVAAALADTALGEAQEMLDELVTAHLIQEVTADRYRFHDLIRAYTIELADAIDAPRDGLVAVERMLDYYLHAAAAASDHLESSTSRRNFTPANPIRPDLIEVQPARSMDWLETERANLVAAVRRAEMIGEDRYTWQLARAIWPLLYLRCYVDDLVDTHRRGLAAAERLAEPGTVATMHNYLASAYYRTWQLRPAVEHTQHAIAWRQQSHDLAGEAIARKNLALVYAADGQVENALTEIARSLAIARRVGDGYILASTVANAGAVCLEIGSYEHALRHSRRGLFLARQVGDDQLHAITLGNVGIGRARLGDPSAARRVLTAALAAKRRTSNRYGEAETLNELGAVCRALDRTDEAIRYHSSALVLMREVGDPHGLCAVYHEFGRTLHAAGETAAALELQRQALASASKIGYRYGQARALDGIAACVRETDPESARRHWLRALHLYQELDLPERHDVERQLSTVGSHPR